MIYKYCFVFLFTLLILNVNGQKLLKNEFIETKIAGEYEMFSNYRDDTAHVIVYKVLAEDKTPKYLFYSIRNPAIKAKDGNFKGNEIAFLQDMNTDLKCKIITANEINVNGQKWWISDVEFKNPDPGNKAVGLLYVLRLKSHIYRMLFMYPTIQYKEKYLQESKSVINAMTIL